MKGHKVFLRNPTTIFFTAHDTVAVFLSMPNQYIDHDLGRYKQNDYLGKLTGDFQTDDNGEICRLEVEVSYYHLLSTKIVVLGKSFTLPERVRSNVKLWVSPNDIVDESVLPFRKTNAVSRMITHFRLLGEGFIASSPRLHWLANKLRTVQSF